MAGQSVAFIGLGNLGLPIARNLVDDGYSLKVFDLRRESEAVRSLQERGAAFSDPRQALEEGVDYLVTLLPDSETVLETYLGPDGLIEHLKPGTRCVELTSGYPELTVRLGQRVREAGATLIDAPICNGAVPGAYERRLVHLVGGEQADFEACTKLLEVSARAVLHVGPLGMGHALKAINNSVAAAASAVAAEGLALAAALGVEPERAIEIFKECSINNNTFLRTCEAYGRDFNAPPSFRLALQRKDARYASRMAAEAGMLHPIGDAAHAVFLAAEREGLGEIDWSQAAFRVYGLKK